MAAGTTDAPSIKQINLLIMSPAIYQLKCQLQRQHSNMAMLFVVAGASIIAAAIIVQSSVTRFRFGSSAFATCAVLLVIATAGLLILTRSGAPKERGWSFWAADEVLVWQDQFANCEQVPPLVLIAADDVFMRSVLAFHLTRAGFRVEHAANGNQAVARTTRETVVVLFDLVMPETHGFHYLRNIRKSFSSTKIIAITRKRHTQDAVLCRKLGVYDSLTKPLDPNDVVEIVTRAVRDEPVVSVDFALSA